MGIVGVILNVWLNTWTLTPNTLVEGLWLAIQDVQLGIKNKEEK